MATLREEVMHSIDKTVVSYVIDAKKVDALKAAFAALDSND